MTAKRGSSRATSVSTKPSTRPAAASRAYARGSGSGVSWSSSARSCGASVRSSPATKRAKNASVSSAAGVARQHEPDRAGAGVGQRPRAWALGSQPSSAAAARIRVRVSAATPGRSLTANETAAEDTPARRATSAMVGRVRRGSGDWGRAIRVALTLLKRFSKREGKRMRATGAAVGAGLALAALAAAPAMAAGELSVDQRLDDRREVAAGTRAQVLGFEDGRFYAQGWHITGEMGGIVTPPLKLLDSVSFGIDGQWIGKATQFTSGAGYVRYDLPRTAGIDVERTDVAPDGVRGALLGLELRNPGNGARTVRIQVDAHSELMGQYPWGFDNVVPRASDNAPDTGAYADGRLVFRDTGQLRRGRSALLHRDGRLRSRARDRRGRPGPLRPERHGPDLQPDADARADAERSATTARSARAPAAGSPTSSSCPRAARGRSGSAWPGRTTRRPTRAPRCAS